MTDDGSPLPTSSQEWHSAQWWQSWEEQVVSDPVERREPSRDWTWRVPVNCLVFVALIGGVVWATQEFVSPDPRQDLCTIEKQSAPKPPEKGSPAGGKSVV